MSQIKPGQIRKLWAKKMLIQKRPEGIDFQQRIRLRLICRVDTYAAILVKEIDRRVVAANGNAGLRIESATHRRIEDAAEDSVVLRQFARARFHAIGAGEKRQVGLGNE